MGCHQPQRRPLSKIRWNRVLQHKLPWNSESPLASIYTFSISKILFRFGACQTRANHFIIKRCTLNQNKARINNDTQNISKNKNNKIGKFLFANLTLFK